MNSKSSECRIEKLALFTVGPVYPSGILCRLAPLNNGRLQLPPLFNILAVEFQMMPCQILQESRHAHFAFTEPADNIVNVVTGGTADKHGLPVANLRGSEKLLPIFIQRCLALFGGGSSDRFTLYIRFICKGDSWGEGGNAGASPSVCRFPPSIGVCLL